MHLLLSVRLWPFGGSPTKLEQVGPYIGQVSKLDKRTAHTVMATFLDRPQEPHEKFVMQIWKQ